MQGYARLEANRDQTRELRCIRRSFNVRPGENIFHQLIEVFAFAVAAALNVQGALATSLVLVLF